MFKKLFLFVFPFNVLAASIQIDQKFIYSDSLPDNTYFYKNTNNTVVPPVVTYNNTVLQEHSTGFTKFDLTLSNYYDDTIIEHLTGEWNTPINSSSRFIAKIGTISLHRGLYENNNSIYNISTIPPQSVYNIKSDTSILNQYNGVSFCITSLYDSFYRTIFSVGFGGLRKVSEDNADLFAFNVPVEHTTLTTNQDLVTAEIGVSTVLLDLFMSYTTTTVNVWPTRLIPSQEIVETLNTNPKTATYLLSGTYRLNLTRLGTVYTNNKISIGAEGFILDTIPLSEQSAVPVTKKNTYGYYVVSRYFFTSNFIPFISYSFADSDRSLPSIDQSIGLKYIFSNKATQAILLEFHNIETSTWVSPVDNTVTSISNSSGRHKFNTFVLSYAVKFSL